MTYLISYLALSLALAAAWALVGAHSERPQEQEKNQ